VKAWLSQEGVPFTAYNVDEDDRAYDDLLARGHRTIPVTVIGDRTIIGYDPAALADATAAWRGQTSDRGQS
jgi:glutaredoxin-like protein NrdH